MRRGPVSSSKSLRRAISSGLCASSPKMRLKTTSVFGSANTGSITSPDRTSSAGGSNHQRRAARQSPDEATRLRFSSAKRSSGNASRNGCSVCSGRRESSLQPLQALSPPTGGLVAAAASSIPADGIPRCSGCKLYPRRRDPSLQRLHARSRLTGTLVAAAASSIPADRRTRCSGCKLDPRRPEDLLQPLQARSPPKGTLVVAAASSIPAEGRAHCSHLCIVCYTFEASRYRPDEQVPATYPRNESLAPPMK